MLLSNELVWVPCMFYHAGVDTMEKQDMLAVTSLHLCSLALVLYASRPLQLVQPVIAAKLHVLLARPKLALLAIRR